MGNGHRHRGHPPPGQNSTGAPTPVAPEPPTGKGTDPSVTAELATRHHAVPAETPGAHRCMSCGVPGRGDRSPSVGVVLVSARRSDDGARPLPADDRPGMPQLLTSLTLSVNRSSTGVDVIPLTRLRWRTRHAPIRPN
jgi:hypothetical protein